VYRRYLLFDICGEIKQMEEILAEPKIFPLGLDILFVNRK
jgi:hypothetical protein